MAEMILEEPPRNKTDLSELILDYLELFPKWSKDDIESILTSLFSELSLKITFPSQNWVTERLDQAFKMEETVLISEQEERAGYTETPFTFEQLRFCNDMIDSEAMQDSQKLKKAAEKERQRKAREVRERREKMVSIKNRLPAVKKKHIAGGCVDVSVQQLTVEVSGKVLISDSQLLLSAGRRYGLVGRNGTGKTTLLYAIAKNEIEGLPEKQQVLMIEQEIDGEEKSPISILLETDFERSILMEEEKWLVEEKIGNEERLKEIYDNLIKEGLMNEEERGAISDEGNSRIERADKIRESLSLNMNPLLKEELFIYNSKDRNLRLREIQGRLDEIEAGKAEAQARTLLAGLGFTQKMMDSPTLNLSGGWRMRVALAKVLYCEPDLLLLDEPTNHLDLDAVLWLEDYLLSFKGTVLVVSHARGFLDQVCTDIIHLENERLVYYRGGFEEFETQRQANIERNLREQEAVEREAEHVQSFIDRFRANAKKASLVQSRIKYLERIKRTMPESQGHSEYECPIAFGFSEPEFVRSPVIRLDEATFGYPGLEPIIEGASFTIESKSRIALLGANGVGKTTLLRLLTGDLKVSEGSLSINTKARISMFSQHHVEKLDLALSPIEQFSVLYPSSSTEQIRKHLSSFGISGSLSLRPMYLLSGGQKSRVCFSMVAWENPHVLVLDEPTNHLDMETVDALIGALYAYKGAVLVVSHDQYFVSCICEDIWYIKNKSLKKFSGDFEAYKVYLASDKL